MNNNYLETIRTEQAMIILSKTRKILKEIEEEF